MKTQTSISPRRYSILLVHACDWTAFCRIPKLFADAGCEVDLIAREGSLVTRSRFIRRVYPESSTEAIAARFKECVSHSGERRYDRVVFADERILRYLALHFEPWMASFLPVRPELLRLLGTKSSLIGLDSSLSSFMPDTHLCSSVEEALAAAEAIGYPIFMKPDSGSGGRYAGRARSADELVKLLGTGKSLPCLVQPFVSGQLGSTCVLFSKGIPLAYCSSFKHLVHPPETGPSCARKLEDIPAQDMVEVVGKATHFDGLAGIDWMWDDAAQRIWLLEINMRPVTAYHLGPLVGVSFSKAIRDWLKGETHQQIPSIVGSKIVYMYPQHLYRCMHTALGELRYWIPGLGLTDRLSGEPNICSEINRRLRREALSAFRSKVVGTLRVRVPHSARST